MRKSFLYALGLLFLASVGQAQSPLDSSVFFASVHGTVWAMTTLGDSLVAAGNFDSIGGIAANSIAEWDGTKWEPFGNGIHGEVRVLAKDSSGGLYIGGKFDSAASVAALNIAHWDSSGWSPLGSGVNDTVFALCIAKNSLFAGGSFTEAGSLNALRIAKWYDSSKIWDTLANLKVLNGSVHAIQNRNTFLIGGDFTAVNGDTSLHYINDPVGNSSGGPISPVFAMSSIRGIPIIGGVRSVRLRLTGSPYWGVNSQQLYSNWLSDTFINGNVESIAPLDAKHLLMCGSFDTLEGKFMPNVALFDGIDWRPLLHSVIGIGSTGCWVGRNAFFAVDEGQTSTIFVYNYSDTIRAYIPSPKPDTNCTYCSIPLDISNDSNSNATLTYRYVPEDADAAEINGWFGAGSVSPGTTASPYIVFQAEDYGGLGGVEIELIDNGDDVDPHMLDCYNVLTSGVRSSDMSSPFLLSVLPWEVLIQPNTSNFELHFVNVLGQCFRTASARNRNPITIPLSELPRGVIFLNAVVDGKSITKSFVNE